MENCRQYVVRNNHFELHDSGGMLVKRKVRHLFVAIMFYNIHVFLTISPSTDISIHE